MSSLSRTLASLTLFVLAPLAAAQPTLVVNNVPTPPQTDNTAVPHLKRTGPLSLKLKGTPNAPFALMLAGDAFDGSPGGEPSITSGFFLKPWVIPGTLDVPIHPVLDGIGMEFIRQKLNGSGQASLAPDDIVNDVPSPIARFNAAGEFNLSGIVPNLAVLVNLTPSIGAPNPLPIALESAGATTIALYLQVVELNTATLAVTTGTGCKVIFDPLTFQAEIAYAEGTSTALPSSSTSWAVTQTVFPSTITDSDLADGTATPPVAATDFSFATQGIDFWVIALAEFQGLYEASNPANQVNGLAGNPNDQDSVQALSGTVGLTVGVWNQVSHLEFLAGGVPARNNENKEFPRIDLPGNRSLFHYRDVATGRYGFGILFRDTNTWRNLTPSPTFTFTNSSVLSAWEYEVAVTPDGNRAVVILDQPSPATTDRVFMLNLEPNGNFTNGLPIYEFVPSSSDLINFSRVYEESLSITTDGAGSWVAFFATTSVPNPTVATYPNRLFRVNLADSVGTPSLVLPGPVPTITRVDRQHMVTPDRDTLLVIAGSSAAAEHVYAITNITTAGQSVINTTGSGLVALQIGEFNEANNGALGQFTIDEGGVRFSFTREDGTNRWPRIASVDGSTAGITEDLIKDITDNGVIDKADFPNSRDHAFSKDGNFLLYQQGFPIAGALPDRYEQFVTDINSKITRNLSRTCKTGAAAAPATLFGPWDPNVAGDRGTLEPCGNFKNSAGDYLYFLRELRGLTGVNFDRQNIVAISIAPPIGLTEPTFEMINVTGTEFEAFDGEPPPAFGGPDISAGGSSFGDTSSEQYRLRRVGGAGPYKDYIYLAAQLANLPVGDPRGNIEQVFCFDSANPGPAIQLTSFFNGTGSPYALRTGARIMELLPSQNESKVLVVVDNGDQSGAPDNAQDLFLLDFASFGVPTRVPANATPFSRIIVRGSSRFYPGATSGGIVFAAGLTQRPAGAFLDGFATPAPDTGNALDSTPFFYRTAGSTSVTPIVPFTTNSRGSMVFNVLLD